MSNQACYRSFYDHLEQRNCGCPCVQSDWGLGPTKIVFLLLHLATQTRRNTIKWGKHLTHDQFDSLWIKGSGVSGVWFRIKYDWMDRGKLCWMVIIAFSSSLQFRRLPKDCSGCVPFQINTHWTNGDCWRVQISVQTDKSQLWTQQQFRP